MRYLNFVERYPRSILAALALITAFFIYAMEGLVSDTNPYLLKESHPARESLIDLQGEFTGTYDSVMVALSNPNTVFNQATLDALYTISQEARKVILTNDTDIDQLKLVIAKHPNNEDARHLADKILKDGLSQIDYIDALELSRIAENLEWPESDRKFLRFLAERINPIREMASMADFENIVLSENGILTIHKSLRDTGMPPSIVRSEIMGNELMVDGVVSRDEKVALIVAELGTKQDDAEAQLRAYHAFQKIVSEYKAQHPEFEDSVYIAGMPIFIAAQEEVIDHDLGLLFPAVFLIITIMLILLFRRVLGLVLPILNILCCTIWTMGFMAIFAIPVDLLTSVLPVFLFTICSSDAIHYMAEYYSQKNSGKSYKDANREAFKLMTGPIILTTITTVATFTISTLTNIVSIRNFGICMSFGLTAALAISLLLIPAWLSLFGRDAKHKNQESEEFISGVLLAKVISRLISHRRQGIVIALFALAVMTVLTFRVEIEDSGITYFEADSHVRISDEFINKNVAGTAPGWIAIDSGQPRGMLNVETLQFLDDLDKFLKSQDTVSYGYSLATYIKRMNLVLNDMNPEFLRVPQSQETIYYFDDNNVRQKSEVDGNDLIDQHIMLFENSGGSDLTNVLNADYSKSVTLYTMTSSVASDYRELLRRLDEWLIDNRPAHLEVQHAGTQVIWTGVLTEITKGQLLSFTLALLVVTLMMMGWLKSWRLGLLGVLPLAATAVTLYACMYLIGIELNIGTVLVTYLVIGIVDYTAHYILRIKTHVTQGAPVDEAIVASTSSVGRSIFFNVAIFTTGFLALLLSDYKPIVDLGFLVALALVVSGVMTFVVVTLFAPWFFSPLAEHKNPLTHTLDANINSQTTTN